MTQIDFLFVLHWWAIVCLLGILFFPITSWIFSEFFDRGYAFAKILGIALIAYATLVGGILHILPFTQTSMYLLLLLGLGINGYIIFVKKKDFLASFWQKWQFFLIEEILFVLSLFFWAFVRAHQPDIQGLEKFMDFGFINAILRDKFFPPTDMWYTPFSINYYYFGHLVTAVLTKLSGIPSFITFNLMVATIFALAITASFSIGANFIYGRKKSGHDSSETAHDRHRGNNAEHIYLRSVFAGLFSAFLVSFAGNLHTIYTLFTPYQNENPLPFWQLPFSWVTFPNSYWYPNATRFIYHTIHEFPIYSYVVSDLHGHVLDIPFVLFTISLLFVLFQKPVIKIQHVLFVSFFLAILGMTNAWDGLIYFLLAAGALFTKEREVKQNIYQTMYLLISMLIGFFIFLLPFSIFIKPFASMIGVLCAPQSLVNITHLGPFLFEPNHCQHSPLWQLSILYGFFYFWVISFIVFLFLKKEKADSNVDRFIILLIALSTILIIIPEFFYLKDIYPEHYRANTMFKLVYQAFIMLSLASGYSAYQIFVYIKKHFFHSKYHIAYVVYLFVAGILLAFVAIYPDFSINSYYGNLQMYRGLNGIAYLQKLYPTDYQAILWLRNSIQGHPVILEAQGDSYTDYARVSANTGLPTVLGWTVHEWLWRGDYAIVAPRITDVETLYESTDIAMTQQLLKKYDISYVFVGSLERQKYKNLDEQKFAQLGKVIFQSGTTKIYQIPSLPN